SSHVWFPDLGDKLGDHLGDKLGDHLGDKLGDHLGDFGDEIWDLKSAGIFSISLLGEKVRHECPRSFHVTSRPVVVDYIRRALGSAFGVLPAVPARKLVS
ncbi:hypothetical protein AVEN_113464-1, partial [Araneus ventricosus]